VIGHIYITPMKQVAGEKAQQIPRHNHLYIITAATSAKLDTSCWWELLRYNKLAMGPYLLA
jgi:hypothetical protein